MGFLRGVFPYFGEVAFGVGDVFSAGLIFAAGFPQPVLSVDELVGVVSLGFRQVLPSFGQLLLGVGDVFGLIGNGLTGIDQAFFGVDDDLAFAEEAAAPGRQFLRPGAHWRV